MGMGAAMREPRFFLLFFLGVDSQTFGLVAFLGPLAWSELSTYQNRKVIPPVTSNSWR